MVSEPTRPRCLPTAGMGRDECRVSLCTSCCINASMHLSTKDDVLKAFRAEIVNTRTTERLDSDSQFDDEDDDDGADLPLPEVQYIRSDNGLRIQLVFSNERAEMSGEDGALFSFLDRHAATIPAHVAKEIRSEILERSWAVGDVVRRVWIYEVDSEQVFDLLTRLIDDVIPTKEMMEEILLDFNYGSGELSSYSVDSSPSSQQFHRRMLEIGAYPTICHPGDSPDSQMRLMYGDERFESFDADDWEKFRFAEPEY